MKKKQIVIQLIDFVPKEWNFELIDDFIIVWYIIKGRGNSPKSFTLPREVLLDENFIEAVGMYLGDGKLSKDLVHLGYSSIDMDMSKFILDFFMNRFGVGIEHMTISIRFKEFKKEVLQQWSNALGVPTTKLKVQMTQLSRNESCEMQISGKVFRILFGNILETIQKSNFLNNKKLRRAFLRGLFATEGNIAINQKQNYIVCIQYHLSYHETYLASLIMKALKLEGIKHTYFKQERDTSLTIRMTGWQNYQKCWGSNLFGRSLRKEFLFLSKMRVTRFSCKLSEKMKERLFNVNYFSHRQLALFVGWNPTSFCKLLRRECEYVNIEYIIKLSKIASVPLEKVKTGIIEFRVNDVTPIEDKAFIDFVFDLKVFAR